MFYKEDTVKTFARDIDALVILGSLLDNSLARSITFEALQRDMMVVEVNEKSSIEVGNALQIKENCQSAVGKLAQSYIKSK